MKIAALLVPYLNSIKMSNLYLASFFQFPNSYPKEPWFFTLKNSWAGDQGIDWQPQFWTARLPCLEAKWPNSHHSVLIFGDSAPRYPCFGSRFTELGILVSIWRPHGFVNDALENLIPLWFSCSIRAKWQRKKADDMQF
jgi:hypothetical protein